VRGDSEFRVFKPLIRFCELEKTREGPSIAHFDSISRIFIINFNNGVDFSCNKRKIILPERN